MRFGFLIQHLDALRRGVYEFYIFQHLYASSLAFWLWQFQISHVYTEPPGIQYHSFASPSLPAVPATLTTYLQDPSSFHLTLQVAC